MRSIVVALAAACLAAAPCRAADCQGPLKVAIDAGHSPAGPGTPSATGKTELSFNLRLASEIAAAAKAHPRLTIVLVNPGDKEVSLADRTKAAAAERADLLVSIHHDSTHAKYWQQTQVAGATPTYSTAFKGFSMFVSAENPEFAASLATARAIGRRLKANGLTQSLHHAEPIEGEGRKVLDWELGIYEAPFAVLKNAASASVLIEAGVLIHPEEELLLESPVYRQRIVGAIVGALAEEVCNGRPAKAP